MLKILTPNPVRIFWKFLTNKVRKKEKYNMLMNVEKEI